MNDKFNFGRRIQNLLDENQRSQTSLARYLGVTSPTVTQWCSGKSSPTYDKLEAIARYFRMTVPQLLTEDDTTEAPTPALVFTTTEATINGIQPGSKVRVEINLPPEIGDIVLYKSDNEARLLRLAAYKDGISVLMQDTPNAAPVITKDKDFEIVGTATAVILKDTKKEAATANNTEAASDTRSKDNNPNTVYQI